MNPKESHAPAALREVEDAELIGLRVIRLRHVGRRTGGIVRSFDAANKMLLDWSSRIKGTVSCEYEIVYVDGRVLNGLYSFPAKGRTRPSLTRHLRTRPNARAQLSQLTCYEVEDFAIAKRTRRLT